MKTIFRNFLNAIIPRNTDPQLDYVTRADINFKLQIITYVCLVTAILVSLTIPLRLMSTEVTQGVIVNVVGLIFTIFIIALINKTKDYKIAGIILSIGTLLIIPARAYNGGGIHTAVITLYVVHTTIMFSLFGRKVGLWFLFIDSISIYAISYFPTIYMLHNSHIFAIMLVLMLAVNTISILIILNSKDALTKRLRQYEQAASSNLIMSRLSHEVFNAITIVMLRLKTTKQDHELDEVYKKLNEITEIIKKMHSYTKDEALIEILEKYKDDVKLLDRLKSYDAQ